ncbi:MAG: PAS domain S-box protein [Beijerinckiaceae bacterium]|nr:MAG: PAS domain S-box protein [Beijerinckiaceae bacterium]
MESQANLLIVEADDVSRDAKLRLFKDAGWNVSAAAPGAEALHDIEMDGFDVFLLGKDAQQPGGMDLDQTIRLRNPTAPIVHVGSKGEAGSKAGFRSDADGYLIEPFEPRELVTLVESLLHLRRARSALRDAEARLQLAQDAGGLAVFDWNLITGHALWSDKFAELFHLKTDPPEGHFDPEVIGRHLHPDDKAAFAEEYRSLMAEGGVFDHDFRVFLPDGDIRWITVRGKFIKGQAGRLERVLCLSLDITERKQADLRNAQLAAIVASSIDAIVSIDFTDTILTWNKGAEQLFGYMAQEILGRKADFLVPEELLPERRGIMQRLMKGEAIEYQTQRSRKDGQKIEVWIRGAPVTGLDGNLVGGSLIIRDITAQKQREAHVRLLMRELTHRSKNLLAVIQAMARQSLTLLTSPEEFVVRFSERLSGLAGSHDLLSSEDWEGASLVQLIRSQLQHYSELFGVRIHLEGPDLILKPEAAQNIGIALHELSTNAAKFGALSVDQGTITISWSLVMDENNERRVHMRWEERNGPPVVAPGHKGFGRMVMDRIIGQALGGVSEAQFAPDGVCWSLDVPAASVIREPTHEIMTFRK